MRTLCWREAPFSADLVEAWGIAREKSSRQSIEIHQGPIFLLPSVEKSRRLQVCVFRRVRTATGESLWSSFFGTRNPFFGQKVGSFIVLSFLTNRPDSTKVIIRSRVFCCVGHVFWSTCQVTSRPHTQTIVKFFAFPGRWCAREKRRQIDF